MQGRPNTYVQELDTAILAEATGTHVTIGLTANSFNSVSLEPPLVLWSLSRAAASMAVFSAGSHYAINVLAADQKELAERCHLHPSTVSNMMSGKTKWPRDTTLFPVLDALGLEMRVVKKGTKE